MSRTQTDVDVIQVELSFLRSKFNEAFEAKNFRKLRALSLWISRLEKKLEQAEKRRQKTNLNYILEYKNGKKETGIVSR